MKKLLSTAILFALAAAIWFCGSQLYLIPAWPFGQSYHLKLLSAAAPPPPAAPAPPIQTHFYDLALERVKIPVPTERGAMAHLGDTLIVSGRNGDLYQIVPDRQPTASKLGFRVPINLSDERLSKFHRRTLSILDLEVIKTSDSQKLYASYFDFDAEKSCLQINLASITIQGVPAANGGNIITSIGDWNIHYRTRPCLSIAMLWPGSLFGGGGRIELYRNDLLLSVGSIGVDGIGPEPPVSQLPEYDYGKVLRLSLDGSGREIFTSGHRNPQGLAVLASGIVVATEHGPQGGDEINILEANNNYGWPLVTYGTNYDSRVWALNENSGRHGGFRKPLLAFVPSVGISEIVEVARNDQFPEWNGDFLVATLREQTLLRARYDEGRIIYVEPIKIGSRLRDISTMPDGTIALLTDSDELVLVRNASAEAGIRHQHLTGAR